MDINSSKQQLIRLLLSFILILFFNSKTFSQIEITGRVMDGIFGGGLPATMVSIKGTNIVTTADDNGRFKIMVPDTNAILSFESTCAYLIQEIRIGKLSIINLTLKGRIRTVEEVIKERNEQHIKIGD